MIETIDDYLFDPGMKAQVIISKVTSLLSLVGSLSIIVDYARDREKRTKMYNSIVLWMSACDTFSSLFHFLGTWMMPKTFAYLAGGTSLTCTIQGFIIVTAASTSSLYNGVLAITFVLVIVRNWRQEDLRKLKWRLLYTPIMISSLSSILAVVGQLFNPRRAWTCMIGMYPPQCTLKSDMECERGNEKLYSLVMMMTLLIFFVTLITVISCMVLLYKAVLRQEQRMLSYSFDPRASGGQRSREVAMQGIKYVAAYLITFIPYTILAILVILRIEMPLFLQILNSIFLPMQGFFNALVYYKKPCQRLYNYFCCRDGEIIDSDEGGSADDPSESESGNELGNILDNGTEHIPSVERRTAVTAPPSSEISTQDSELLTGSISITSGIMNNSVSTNEPNS